MRVLGADGENLWISPTHIFIPPHVVIGTRGVESQELFVRTSAAVQPDCFADLQAPASTFLSALAFQRGVSAVAPGVLRAKVLAAVAQAFRQVEALDSVRRQVEAPLPETSRDVLSERTELVIQLAVGAPRDLLLTLLASDTTRKRVRTPCDPSKVQAVAKPPGATRTDAPVCRPRRKPKK